MNGSRDMRTRVAPCNSRPELRKATPVERFHADRKMERTSWAMRSRPPASSFNVALRVSSPEFALVSTTNVTFRSEVIVAVNDR